MKDLTPKNIVNELDRHIIGQAAAKRAVAVAIRNRWRRQRLEPGIAAEINPKNIIMVGPTGVGKTEIARRIATLTGAPFIKVEATKFTEVGYHGRDVESIIRDLLEQAIGMVRTEQAESVRTRAEERVEQRLAELLLPGESAEDDDDAADRRQRTLARLIDRLRTGELNDREVDITLTHRPTPMAVLSGMGPDQMDPDLSRMLENMMPEQSTRRRMRIADARNVLLQQETERLIDRDKIAEEAIRRTEHSGIVFLDEIDKIATGSGEGGRSGPDVSRQGVQRDLLPIVEGSSVTTRHGLVQTDHILFIAAGAFSAASVGDLMPELQGRFPIRVELEPLTRADFIRILTEPSNALTKQQASLLGTEGLELKFSMAAIEAMADMAAIANERSENIGARRLMTVIEKLLEDIHFDAPELAASGTRQISITEEMVRQRLADIAQDEDLSRFVL